MTMPATNSLRDRALALILAGCGTNQVAEACGVTPARISQLMDEPEFKERLSNARYEKATAAQSADTKLDALEDKIVTKLEASLDYVFDPMKLLRAFQVVNGAKRRAAGAPVTADNNGGIVVNLTMPNAIVQRFETNIQNQVVKAGGEDLLTIQPSVLKNMIVQRAQESKDEHSDTNSELSPPALPDLLKSIGG